MTPVKPGPKIAPVRTPCWLARAAAFLAEPIELILVLIDWKMFGDVPSKTLFFDPGPSWPAMTRQTQKWPFLVVFGFFDK